MIDNWILWPLKFPASLNENNTDTSRKFKRVIFEKGRFFSEPRSDVKEVAIGSAQISYASLSNVLLKVPNVEKITIVRSQMPFASPRLSRSIGHQEDEVMIPELNNLETLELETLRPGLLDKFERSQIVNFIFSGCLDASCDQNEIDSFFAGQKSLSACELNYCSRYSSISLFKQSISSENVPFKLKKLSLTCFNLEPPHYEHLLKFIEIHALSLKTLNLGYNFPASIYEFAFAKLGNLEKLGLITDSWREDAGFLKRLEINRSVTTLALFEHEEQCDAVDAATIIRKLPNIENLVLMIGGAYETLTATSEDLKKLKHLTVLGYDSQFWQSVTLPKLESVKFFNAELEQEGDIAFVARNSNLHSMVFDGCVDNDFLTAISEHFPKLVSLDLKKTQSDAEGFDREVRGLRLRDDDFFKNPKTSGEFFSEKDFQRVLEEVEDYSDDNYYEYEYENNRADSWHSSQDSDMWRRQMD